MNKLRNFPKIFIALDFNDIEKAKNFVNNLNPGLCGLKIGKELFTSCGPNFIDWAHKKNFKTFLDLKFHDIPTTVKKSCISAANLGVSIINIHALGGKEMMLSAKEGLLESKSNALLIAVTILTSHDEASVIEIGLHKGLKNNIESLAIQAAECDLDGIVCSAEDIKAIKTILPKNFIYITPGIRLKRNQSNDQKRIMSPKMALKEGSDILVIGRSITESKNPNQTLIYHQRRFVLP